MSTNWYTNGVFDIKLGNFNIWRHGITYGFRVFVNDDESHIRAGQGVGGSPGRTGQQFFFFFFSFINKFNIFFGGWGRCNLI